MSGVVNTADKDAAAEHNPFSRALNCPEFGIRLPARALCGMHGG